jgi:iron complex outermembrane receptor protein
VPLSISAQTGQAMIASGMRNLTDVKFNTPGFIAQSGTGYTQIYIRGIGNGVYVGADPSIATFVDDVPHPYGSLVEDLVNVERVEVLKGAQGGLYGRNASGGVVNIITKQPSDRFSAFGRFTGASRKTFNGSIYVNMPLNDRIAWNFSLTRNWHAPYRKNVAYRNPYPGQTAVDPFAGPFNPNAIAKPGKLNNLNVWSFDTKLRVKLTDNLKVTLSADYTDDHDASGNGWLQTTPDFTYAVYESMALARGVTPVPRWKDLNIKSNKSYGAIPNTSYTEDYGGSAKVELGLEGVDLTSITAFRWNNSNYMGDIGAAPVPMAGFSTDFRRRFFYQELRAVSTGSGPLRWLGGVTYFRDKIDASIAGISFGLFFPPTTSTTRTTNWSVYGQLAYDVTDKLTLQGSLRYAHEKKTVDFPDNINTGPVDPIKSQTKVHKWIPAATLSYKVPGGTVYARYAKGFKTGGPNPLVRPDRIFTADKTGLILKPETVDTYEIGYRATLFDRKVQFTSAIFYNNYKGIHATTSGTLGNEDISNALINLGNARTYGAEASVVWRVSEPITISGNLGYLNAKYKKAEFPGNTLIAGVSASHNRMLLAPKWQGGFQVNLDQPLNDSTRLKGNLLYSYISSHYFTAEEQPTTRQKGYSLVNLRAGVTFMNDRYGLYLFANNLFDKRYYLFGSSAAVGDFATPADPRIIGGTVEVKF